jgi:hypothetical protein
VYFRRLARFIFKIPPTWDLLLNHPGITSINKKEEE